MRLAGGGAAADVTAWPEFHNGVAAGLQLAPSCARARAPGPGTAASSGGGPGDAGAGGGARVGSGGAGGGSMAALGTLPDAPSYTHAGLLLALGLTGHLAQLPWTDMYR